jgi:oxygen-independent coproporphyrinogen-3 oxidase
MTSLGLYLHLPFCRQKCHYCDFASYAGKEDLIDAYIDTLICEIQALAESFCHPLSTIYFGGGTPTLLEPRHFEKILHAINRLRLTTNSLPLTAHGSRQIETTIEANPGTVDREKLTALHQLGINRISLGAQTFNNHRLKILGRIHAAKEIYAAVDAARSAGFGNLNLDLIFAIPGQTLAEWKDDLKQALSLNPEHISAYNLQIEDGSRFNVSREAGSRHIILNMESGQRSTLPPLPTEEEELAMYTYTIETLKVAGYHHYEISNFAKPEYECRHNINYWKNGNYLGVGAAASSHINGNRFDNPRTIEDYLKWVAAPGTKNKTAILLKPNHPDQGETIFMGLRLLDGLPKENFSGFKKIADQLIEEGLLKTTRHTYRLSRKGLYLANEVFRQFV